MTIVLFCSITRGRAMILKVEGPKKCIKGSLTRIATKVSLAESFTDIIT